MESRKGPIKVPVRDKRRATLEGSEREPTPDRGPEVVEEQKDYEDLYLRAVADLENERKRFKARESERAERAVHGLIESLLPVLDNFERAIAHGEGGEGVALVFKQLTSLLESEGLVEISAEGAEFDPNVHEAVESRPQEGLEVPTVIEVHRRGYMLKDRLLRAALVVVGRPTDPDLQE